MKAPLSILYQDQWLIAIDKPTGVLVHSGDDPNTVGPIAMKLLRDQIGSKVWPVHRLDCPTSGVLLFSLSDQLQPHLRKLFEIGGVEKRYEAIVLGEVPEQWICDQPIRKSKIEPDKESETRFIRKSVHRVDDKPYSLVSIKPITGRFHQIRKHLAISGFPIAGDYRYGDQKRNDDVAKLIGSKDMMLHANQLILSHLVTGDELIIDAPRPERFDFLLAATVS